VAVPRLDLIVGLELLDLLLLLHSRTSPPITGRFNLELDLLLHSAAAQAGESGVLRAAKGPQQLHMLRPTYTTPSMHALTARCCCTHHVVGLAGFLNHLVASALWPIADPLPRLL